MIKKPLNLQRASAGSGKTYALARAYIKMLISEVDSSGRRRLRPDAAMPDAVRRILAITFTNKATAEMKSRIVARMADLAAAGPQLHDAGPEQRAVIIKNVTYLGELAEQTGATLEQVSHACDVALRAMLDDYSGFQVSTIDSFFQSVLRTFAYEVDLNDAFELELDSDMLTDTGIDLTMESLSEGTADSSTEKWLRQLSSKAADNGKRWNPSTPTSSKDSIRNSIFKIVKQMESEHFKGKRHLFDRWFIDNPDYAAVVDKCRDECETAPRLALEQAKTMAKALERAFDDAGLDLYADGASYMVSHCNAILRSHDHMSFISNKYENTRDKIDADPLKTLASKVQKGKGAAAAADLREAAMAMYGALEQWKESLDSEKVRLWSIYKPTIEFPALMHNVRMKVQQFLSDNNIVELSDTNTLLNRIIGDDDAPFIYERLGSRLEHYLIDEFQDTSKMQWENLYPLVNESEAGNFDNLIIGDAKQSIYRFRNADPSLITERVPAEFSGRIELTGHKRADNSNHRSLERVVRFNNLFFSRAAYVLNEVNSKSGIDTTKHSLTDLYSNVVQYPARMEKDFAAGKGYVELNFINSDGADTDNADGAEATADQYSHVGPLIDSLLDRGYRQKDIGILVERNEEGSAVIEHLLQYGRRADRRHDIRFVSDESLRLSLARSVRVIISTLELMATSAIKTDTSGRTHITGSAIYSTISRMAMQNPNLDLSEAYRQYMLTDEGQQSIGRLISHMHSMTLPALVEVIVAEYVPSALQQSEAPFIAAFQDAVLEYCKVYPTDIASFLDWWRAKGSKLTVSAPRGTNAVNIMTIHKSKGLEFKCVILPSYSPSLGKDTDPIKSASYIWMQPALQLPDGLTLPPVIPVKITRKMVDCEATRDAYLDNLYSETMDRFNSMYVAFTRACDELYVFCPLAKTDFKTLQDIVNPPEPEPELPVEPAPNTKKKSKSTKKSDLERDPARVAMDALAKKLRKGAMLALYLLLPECSSMRGVAWLDTVAESERESLADAAELHTSDLDGKRFTIRYGKPIDDPKGLLEKEKASKGVPANPPVERKVESYSPAGIPDGLRFKRSPVTFDEDDLSDEFGPDPRRRGNVLHAILAEVSVVADLPEAVKRHVVTGELTPDGGEQVLESLRKAIARPEVAPWFDGSMRVLNERHLLYNGNETRPDRVLVSPDGKQAIVIDYKFGSVSDANYNKKKQAYRNQVNGYVRGIRNALGIRQVTGWLWYVVRDELERVE